MSERYQVSKKKFKIAKTSHNKQTVEVKEISVRLAATPLAFNLHAEPETSSSSSSSSTTYIPR